MAASLTVELEHGTSEGRGHPHNGYYAGNFSAVPYLDLSARNTRFGPFDPETA